MGRAAPRSAKWVFQRTPPGTKLCEKAATLAKRARCNGRNCFESNRLEDGTGRLRLPAQARPGLVWRGVRGHAHRGRPSLRYQDDGGPGLLAQGAAGRAERGAAPRGAGPPARRALPRQLLRAGPAAHRDGALRRRRPESAHRAAGGRAAGRGRRLAALCTDAAGPAPPARREDPAPRPQDAQPLPRRGRRQDRRPRRGAAAGRLDRVCVDDGRHSLLPLAGAVRERAVQREGAPRGAWHRAQRSARHRAQRSARRRA